MTKLSKSLNNLFKSLKKNLHERDGEEVHFPEARELFQEAAKMGSIGVGSKDTDFDKMDKLNEQIGSIIEHELKHQWRKGQAEYEGRPVTIHNTWFGKAKRLQALIEDENGKELGVAAHRLKNIRLY